MSRWTVKTNHGARPMVSFAELPVEVGADFEYVPDEEKQTPRFVKYRESWYDVSDSTVDIPDDLKKQGWDSWVTDSYFSAVVFRVFDREGNLLEDEVVVGRIYT